MNVLLAKDGPIRLEVNTPKLWPFDSREKTLIIQLFIQLWNPATIKVELDPAQTQLLCQVLSESA